MALACLIFVAFPATVLMADLADGLVGYWPLNGDARDITGAHHGTKQGNVAYMAGRFDQAIQLDGKDEYVEVAPNPALDITGSLTVALWAKVNAWGPDRYDTMLWKTEIGGGSRAFRLSRNASSDGACFTLNAVGGEAKVRGTTPIKDDQWHHIAGVYDIDTGTAYLYVDGVLDTDPLVTSGNIKDSTGTPLYIGRDPSDVRFWNGLIDEVVLYNRALEEAEIQELVSGARISFAVEPAAKLTTTWGEIKR